MAAIERDNPSLKSVLPKDYARPGLDKQRLGQLINLVSDIGLGSPADRACDILGRVYEYFLSQFASAEGKKGGQFYTPTHVVRVLVAMLAPYKGRVYDPCCGSGGMFVQSEKFIEANSGRIGDISIYGQESNYTTWRLAKMNLAIRGIDAQIAHGDSFHNDQHPDLKADYVVANPPVQRQRLARRVAAQRYLPTLLRSHTSCRAITETDRAPADGCVGASTSGPSTSTTLPANGTRPTQPALRRALRCASARQSPTFALSPRTS